MSARTARWADLRVVCFGDSTTWGDNGTGEGGPAIAWPARLQELLGIGEVVNRGVKGSRIAVCNDRADSFIERRNTLPDRADVVLVLGGVNDFCRNVPLGAAGETDTTTFFGALDTLARSLVTCYPEAVVVFMTPMKTAGVPRKGLPASVDENGCGLVEADYAAAVRAVADRYGMPVIDLFAESTISPYLPEHRERYMPDGLHYSPAGYERLARRIAAGLSAIVCAQ
ncbi:SGNH/GDSL hydrolase family protein [Collinsella tanakaei]|uniref:SGNH/GDSL hydrolase family protein n=1 Tax=Collinsella tanakaei TaxID=626935 RepID=UPI0019584719|nr:SGNH/GDSL hydrolase family protein [Collinsella tanakaei]MBM6754930.1 SGNH/GDSL hydrolase family protein [Collinsella tanakaei]